MWVTGASASRVLTALSDAGRQAGDGAVQLGTAVAPGQVGLGQLGTARRVGTVMEEPVGLDGKGQPAQRARHRTDSVGVFGFRGTVNRLLEGGGGSLDLESHVGAQPLVIGLGVPGQERVSGQASVAQRRNHRPTPGPLTDSSRAGRRAAR